MSLGALNDGTLVIKQNYMLFYMQSFFHLNLSVTLLVNGVSDIAEVLLNTFIVSSPPPPFSEGTLLFLKQI